MTAANKPFVNRGSVDIDVWVPHPTYVLTLARRLAAVAIILTLSAGNVAVCPAWQATPEARMACCKNGTSCPLHKSESHRSTSKRRITQVQADNCCAAASNRTQSPVASPTFGVTDATTLPIATVLVGAVPVLALKEWRAFVPLPVSPVPKHLLFSVLLV